jgi:PAS domain S-box-containing protein
MSERPARGRPTSRAARRSNAAEHFRLMADCAPVMIRVAEPDRRCVYFNRPWLEFTGRPLESQLGHGWADGIHEDDRERCLAACAEGFAAARPFEIDYRLRRADGEYRWLLDKGVPLLAEGRLTGFVGSCLDITDRMHAEQEARRREEGFKTLAENIPDVIARLDRDLRYLYVNRAVEQVFGRKAEEIIGRRKSELGLPAHIVKPLTEAVTCAFASVAEQRFHFQAGSPSASRRHFAGRVIPEPGEAGPVEAVLVIIYDVTARAREDEMRAEILARERSARANAESATLARDQFLAIVSHELRSPLNGIKSWTHVLENLSRDAEPQVKRALAGIMIGVEHQVRLIDDLSDYSIADREIHGDPDRIRQSSSS